MESAPKVKIKIRLGVERKKCSILELMMHTGEQLGTDPH